MQLLKKSLPLHPQSRNKPSVERSEKVLKKSFKIFWRFEKLDLSLHPLSPHNESERSEKKFEKSFKKIWWFQKKVLPLHHFPLRKSGQSLAGLRTDTETEFVLIAIYEQRSLKNLSSKVFIHSKE